MNKDKNISKISFFKSPWYIYGQFLLFTILFCLSFGQHLYDDKGFLKSGGFTMGISIAFLFTHFSMVVEDKSMKSFLSVIGSMLMIAIVYLRVVYY
jgi:hypothetical protein